VHILAALTLFGVLRRTFLRPVLADHFGGGATSLALVASLIWAVHPLQTESVTYIVQRAESIVGLFYLLTLYSVIRAAESKRAWIWQAAAATTCLLGMASKEVMATRRSWCWCTTRCFWQVRYARRCAGGTCCTWRWRRHGCCSGTW